MDQEPAFLIGHDFPVSFFLSAQDGLSELENIFFFFFLTMLPMQFNIKNKSNQFNISLSTR